MTPSTRNKPGHKHACRRVPAAVSRSFTLVEMIVVISIILLILAMVIPATTTLWNQRKAAQAENTIQGLLMVARARAVSTLRWKAGECVNGRCVHKPIACTSSSACPNVPLGGENGFLAFVDDRGVQHLVSIAQNTALLGEPAWQNVFVIADEPDQTLPIPMRVVPRYVVDDPAKDAGGWLTFSSLELSNNDFANPPEGAQPSQRHRNYFTMVYSAKGESMVARDVLIFDVDSDGDQRGDRTKLHVGPKLSTGAGVTTQYYARNGTPQPIDPTGTEPIAFLVTDPKSALRDEVAINFPSVDGLLVYDDSLFSGLPDKERRAFLLRAGQPLYVSRWTGLVIRGPVGETETESP